MASLSQSPKGWELEDLVAAHFAARGHYVETGVTERNPDELLELDIVWTDYSEEPQIPHPVEVKSGDWGVGDLFKFFGWCKYIGLEGGQFVHTKPCGRLRPDSLKRLSDGTGIQLLHVPEPGDVEQRLATNELVDPMWDGLTELWRYSFWAQRRLLKSLSEAVRGGKCTETAKAAKKYHQLINDAVFFLPDIRDRVGELLTAHLRHRHLASSTAYEIATGRVEFGSPPESTTFRRALYAGKHFPVQACLYLGYRARLYVLKAAVDYWLARQRGDIKELAIRMGGKTIIDFTPGEISAAAAAAVEELSALESFRQLPFFWQTFLWTWGGFLLADRLDEEYAQLSRETGVPIHELPAALGAFDKLFPNPPGGWFREPAADSRKVLILMPPAIRGAGAYRRLLSRGLEGYAELGYRDRTAARLSSDHNACVRILDCEARKLAS